MFRFTLFLVALLLVLAPAEADTDDCIWMNSGESTIHQSSSPRLKLIVGEISGLAGITPPLVCLQNTDPHEDPDRLLTNSFSLKDRVSGDETFAILLNENLVGGVTTEALIGYVAHEVANIAIFSLTAHDADLTVKKDLSDNADNPEEIVRELLMKRDELAASWVCKEPLLAMLEDLQRFRRHDLTKNKLRVIDEDIFDRMQTLKELALNCE
jgi:hypothetical protein